MTAFSGGVRSTLPSVPCFVLFSAAQFGQQVLRVDGFGEDFELVALVACAVEQVGGGGLSGKEQDFAGREQTADLDGSVDPVQVGHDDVADEHVGFEGLGGFHRFLAAINGRGFESALIQNDGKGVGDDSFVIC